MKKILVIGCCGSGKSTFSKKLQSILKIEVIHLDQYYHKPNWEEPEEEEWEKTVNKLVKKPSWIMDGTYIESLDKRIEKCDTVIYLDYSILKCFFRVVKRVFADYGKKRSDMAQGCKESIDLSFLKFVLTFNYRNQKFQKQLTLDLIQLNISAIRQSDSQNNAYVLLLNETVGKRQLPIVIGWCEARSIALALEDSDPPERPLTHDLFLSISNNF